MIKNKAILTELEEKKSRVECDNCIYCHLGAFHSGKWYCKNPKVSVMNPPADIDECFERK